MFAGAAVVMGVAGCGKSAVGSALALRLGAHFIEGDSLHPADNIAKMSAGLPLTDEDRWPWLRLVGEALAGRDGRILSCSALKASYRRRIAEWAGRPIRFVFLDGPPELLATRLAARQGHFMPPSLLASQFATLEPPGGDEPARRFSITQPVDVIAAEAAAWLMQQEGQG
jgi:gluconokinase